MTVRAVLASPVPLAAAFGQIVRQARHEAGLTQEELADRAHVHRTYIGDLENARKSPTLDVVEALASALGTPAHELIAAAERLAQGKAARPRSGR